MKSLRNLIGLCLVLLAPMVRGAEPTGEELAKQFFADAEVREMMTSGKAPVSEAIRWLKERMPKGEKGEYDPNSAEVFAAACGRANPAELAELGAMLAGLPRKAYSFEEYFSPYSTAVFRQTVAKLKKEPVKLTLPKPEKVPPKYLAGLPPQMTEAWTQWNAIDEAYTKLMTAAAEDHKAKGTKQPRRMDDTLRKLLPTPEREVWKELTLFEMKGFCGTGMDLFYHPRNRGILLSLLADGRMVEALGAAFAQVPTQSFGVSAVPGQSFQDVVKDLLTACGMDWELVFIGSMLPVEGDDFQKVADQISLRSGFSEISPWTCIAAEGSPRAIKLCLTLMRANGFHPGSCLEFIDVATGAEQEAGLGIPGLTIPGHEPKRARRSPISPELRAEALAIVAGHLSATKNPNDIHAFLGNIKQHTVMDLRAPLKHLMKHPVHPIAARARELLADAGLVAPDAPISPPPPPLRFQVLNNGEPLAGADLDISAEGVQLKTTTDPTGRFNVPLNDVVDLESVKSVSIRALPWSPEVADAAPLEGEKSTGIPGLDSPILPRRKTNAAPGVWPGPSLEMEVQLRPGKDEEYKVSARTASLEIAFDPSSKVKLSTRAKVRLVQSAKGYNPLLVELEGALTETFTFENLQLQDYFIVVLAEGVQMKASNPIRIGSKGSMRLIKLEPGRSVKGSIVGLDGDKMEMGAYASLFQNGKPVDIPPFTVNRGWVGLPLGKYRVLYPSSAEREEEARKFGAPDPDIEPNERHGGIDHEFELTEQSPMVVDLGELRLKPEKPEKEK